MHAQSCQEKVVPHWATGTNLINRRQYYWMSHRYVNVLEWFNAPRDLCQSLRGVRNALRMDDVFLVAHVICKANTAQILSRRINCIWAAPRWGAYIHFQTSRLRKERESPGKDLTRFDTCRKQMQLGPVHHWRVWGADGLADWRTGGVFNAAIAAPMNTLEPLAALPSLHLRWVLLSFSLALEKGWCRYYRVPSCSRTLAIPSLNYWAHW